MHNSLAFVVDGSKVIITPFTLSLMPPPMCFLDLEFPSAVRDLAFCSKTSQNHLAASLSDGSLCVVEFPVLERWDDLEGLTFKVDSFNPSTNYTSLQHLSWLDLHILIGVCCLGFGLGKSSMQTSGDGDVRTGYYLKEIEIRCSEDRILGSVTCSGWHAESFHQIYLDGVVIGIASNPIKRYSAFVQFDGGKVFEYMSKLGLNRGLGLERCDDMGFLSSCPWMDIAPVGGYAREKPLLFGLDYNGRLCLEGKVVCNNCSSFSYYSNSGDGMATHLVIATKQDLLFIVDIDDILKGQLEQYENFLLPITMKKGGEKENIFINMWEKGAQIVGVLHGDESAVILQTPRGNLECVYPRKLVLASIINALAQRRFKDALLMVRRHRIDFNVIVDHRGWQAFVESAADFVRQVNNLSYITEFVCAVKPENIMETLYRNYARLTRVNGVESSTFGEPNRTNGENKVNAVLMAIRKSLEDQIDVTPARELCILTTLAKSNPPALEDALKRIKVIREKELSTGVDPQQASCPSSEESLKHLLWLSDSEAVFEAALGLYDLNLAAIVALNSQKDPKEFLPLLQELERMPLLLMQYNIDLKLKRYESALRHIVSAGDYYEDCLNLMEKVPQLYPLGLQLIGDPHKRKQVLEAWGDHLNATKCFEDAAATYLCCSHLEKALKAYRACGNWTGVLTVAGLLKLGKDDLLQMARELSEELHALGKPGDAAKILIEYCADIENGINLLIEARTWEEALRVGLLHRRDDLILVVKHASLECANTLIGEYNEGIEKVGKYLTRYLAVRQRRLLLAATIKSDERRLDDETASQASSISGMSAYTTGTRKGSSASTTGSTSTKGRGRQRNRGKIRAGSPDEEMALVEHLKGMSLAEGAKCELKSLLISLLMLGEEDTARKLERVAEKFQLSQIAAVKLADDTMPTDNIDEHAFTLDHYIEKVRKQVQNADAFSWQSKVLI